MRFILRGKKKKKKTRAAEMARYPSDLCFDGDEHGGGRKGTGCIFLEERRLRACADLPSADCPLETFSRTLATAS